jgi:hypothetical protein
VLVLQSCTDSLRVSADPSSETFPASSDGACHFSDTKVNVANAINEQVPVRIKQEEIPQDMPFPDIQSEPDEVSFVCVCLFLDTFYLCLQMSVFLFS